MGLIDMIIDMLKGLKYFLSRNARLEREISSLRAEVERQEDEARFWFNRTRQMSCHHCKGMMETAKPVNVSKIEWDNKVRLMDS